MKQRSIWIGFDPREASAFAVCRNSLRRYLTQSIPIHGLVLSNLQRQCLYWRPMEWGRSIIDKPVMIDVISGAAMSTQHANARFLVPHLAKHGWALFCDGDMLFRGNVVRLFDSLDPDKAVYCVKHEHSVASPAVKMDGQPQVGYHRKNWTSFIVFNCDHEANAALTLEMVNTLPGRDLHRLCWLDDDLIGALSPEWNYLVGISEAMDNPKCIHFTEGVPDMAGYENTPFADDWRAELEMWAE